VSTTVGRPSQAGRRLLPSLVWSSDSHYALRDVDRAGRVKAESAEKKQGEEGGEQQQPAAGGPSVLDAAARAAARAADSRITRFVHVRALQFCGFCASPHVRTPPLRCDADRYSAGSFYGDLQDFLKGEDTSQFGFTPCVHHHFHILLLAHPCSS
jgi:hypothetical protein